MPAPHFVGIKADVSPRVRRLCKMRAAELELSQSQYLAALIIADTKHLGSVPDNTEDFVNDNGDAA